MRTLVLVTLSLVATLGFALVSTAASTIDVHLDVDLIGAGEHADCDLTVVDGATGIDLLDEAVSDGCIDSYRTRDFNFGEMVTCVDDICQTPDSTFNALFWAVYVNCGYASGVSSMSLSDGDVVEFSYETWAGPVAVSYACAFQPTTTTTTAS